MEEVPQSALHHIRLFFCFESFQGALSFAASGTHTALLWVCSLLFRCVIIEQQERRAGVETATE